MAVIDKKNGGTAELTGCTEEGLTRLMLDLGERPYRGRQLYEAVYRRRVMNLDALTELPMKLRAVLERRSVITNTRVERVFESADGTRRFLLRLVDGREAEAVFMPEERRDTICISSQVGCPLACDFCMTGVMGLERNMTAGEIISQVVIVLNHVYGAGVEPPHGTNVVMMGMGEPFLNYEEVMKAIRLLADARGMGVSPRRMTVSTAGVVPRIYDFGKEEVRPRLAVSLTAATNELRNRLFPINRKYPLAALIEACRKYPLRERERLTFEYVMLDGVNDGESDARALTQLLGGIRAKVNLIPHNPARELRYRSSPMRRILEFQETLTSAGLPSFIRRPRGRDISAACGQLAARREAGS